MSVSSGRGLRTGRAWRGVRAPAGGARGGRRRACGDAGGGRGGGRPRGRRRGPRARKRGQDSDESPNSDRRRERRGGSGEQRQRGPGQGRRGLGPGWNGDQEHESGEPSKARRKRGGVAVRSSPRLAYAQPYALDHGGTRQRASVGHPLGCLQGGVRRIEGGPRARGGSGCCGWSWRNGDRPRGRVERPGAGGGSAEMHTGAGRAADDTQPPGHASPAIAEGARARARGRLHAISHRRRPWGWLAGGRGAV